MIKKTQNAIRFITFYADAKKQEVFLFLVFLFPYLLDSFLKNFVVSQGSVPLSFWKIKLVQYTNKGIAFGVLSDLPPELSVVFLSTLGAFIFFLFILIQYFFLLDKRLVALKTGVSLMIGGLFSNVLDRFFRGGVLDYINLDIWVFSRFVFNMADVLIWVGYTVFAVSLYKYKEIIFFPENRRGRLFILPSIQLRYILYNCIFVTGAILVAGFFSRAFYLSTLKEELISPEKQQQILFFFDMGFLMLSLFFLLSSFVFSLRLSHRFAGPIYSFRLHIQNRSKGSQTKFALRKNDDLKILEEISQEIDELMD